MKIKKALQNPWITCTSNTKSTVKIINGLWQLTSAFDFPNLDLLRVFVVAAFFIVDNGSVCGRPSQSHSN